jgi:hypothetical protein
MSAPTFNETAAERRYRAVSAAYAFAVGQEQQIEDERPAAKHAAILRVMASGPNEQTGKAHSASSAEAIVEMEPGYADYLKRRRDAVMFTILQRCERDIAHAALLATTTLAGVSE